MDNNNNSHGTDLPYDFDLLYDIKTSLELQYEMVKVGEKLVSMIETCRDHNIPVDDFVKKILKSISNEEI